MKTLITNVEIIDATGRRPGKVLIDDDGKIKKVYKEKGQVKAAHDREIDGQGKVLMPGFIDMHCHLRDPGLTYKEDMETGMKAALKGGFTTLVAMANTKPVMDNAEALKANMDKADALGLCDLVQVCARCEHGTGPVLPAGGLGSYFASSIMSHIPTPLSRSLQPLTEGSRQANVSTPLKAGGQHILISQEV